MNADDLLDYQLGQLDAARREQIEQEIASDPETTNRSARLALSLVFLLDDGRDVEPPADLTARTLAAVEQHRRRAGVLEFAPTRIPFRWSDVAVAAGIFIAGLSTLLPALQRSRWQMQEASCTFNLQQLGQSLASYATTHGAYPQPPQTYPAGYYAVQLKEAGSPFSLANLTCPSQGHSAGLDTLPDGSALRTLVDGRQEDAQRLFGNGYAYNAGYRHAPESYGPVPAARAKQVALPLLADLPPMDGEGRVLLEGNSPSHQGAGQNVLYSDQSVRFLRKRHLPRTHDDIYLNADRQAGLGLHESDVTLLPSSQPIVTRP